MGKWKVCVYAICKNEAKFVRRWMDSMREADWVVVLDTGSDDGTPEMLRKVLAEPKKYAPSGVYIMRIHGTFVNFLDLSPDIQEDIIKRLDMESTRL